PLGVLDPGLPLSKLVPLPPPPLPEPVALAERAGARLEPARDPFARRVFSGALTSLGQIYFLRGEETEAKALFEAGLRARPGDAAALTNLAVLRAQKGDLPGALSLCLAVLARDPSRQVARLNAARYRLALSDLDGAEADFRESARRAPKEAAPLIGLS